MRNGQYGLIEIMPGGDTLIEEGAKSLKSMEAKIDTDKMNAPSFLMVLTGTGDWAYLTTSNDFAADSYEVRAFFYLLKPVEEGRLFQALDGAVEKLKRRRSESVVVATGDGLRQILMERIRYVERVGRCIRYHCTDGTVDSQSIRTPFREMVAPLLADQRFYLCGASFVLNFQHVTRVQGQNAMLDSGQTVPLPRAAAADFKKAWGNYWLAQTHEG